MPSKKYHLGLAGTSVLSLFILAVTPVGAQHGIDNPTGTTTSTTTSGGATTPTTSATESGSGKTTSVQSGTSGGSSTTRVKTDASGNAVVTSTATSTTPAHLEDSKTTLRSEAQKLLETKRSDVKQTKTPEERLKACQAHQDDINTRSTAFATRAQNHLDTLNGIFTKVQAFQTAKQWPVSNYDALVAAATAKQTAAQTAVDTLKAVDVKIDCTAADPASSVAALKTAVANARTALKDYRQAIKDIVVALKAAAPATSTDSTSSSPSSTTGGTQ